MVVTGLTKHVPVADPLLQIAPGGSVGGVFWIFSRAIVYPFFKRWSRFAGAADVGEGGLVAGVPIGAAGVEHSSRECS